MHSPVTPWHFEDLANQKKLDGPTLKAAFNSEVNYVTDRAMDPNPPNWNKLAPSTLKQTGAIPRRKMGLSTTLLMQAHVGNRGGPAILEHFKALAPFLLLFCVGVASAQVAAAAQQAHKIKTPSRFNRRVFVGGISLLAASRTPDAITTRQLLDRGGVGVNSVFGRHPSPLKQAGINAGIFAAQSSAFYLTKRNKHAWD